MTRKGVCVFLSISVSWSRGNREALSSYRENWREREKKKRKMMMMLCYVEGTLTGTMPSNIYVKTKIK